MKVLNRKGNSANTETNKLDIKTNDQKIDAVKVVFIFFLCHWPFKSYNFTHAQLSTTECHFTSRTIQN